VKLFNASVKTKIKYGHKFCKFKTGASTSYVYSFVVLKTRFLFYFF